MKTANWTPCPSSGHSREDQVNSCSLCAPNWGMYPTCPTCGSKLVLSKSRRRGRCQGAPDASYSRGVCTDLGQWFHIPPQPERVVLDRPAQLLAAQFLRYSFRDIAFDYDKLTPQEQRLCTREEYDHMTSFLNKEF